MNFKNIIFFTSGIAAGAAGTYFLMKDKFNKMLNDEVTSVKKYYEEKYSNTLISECDTTQEIAIEDPASKIKEEKKEERAKVDAPVEPDYNEIIDKLNYNQFSTKPKSQKKQLAKKPYIISEDEYNDDTRQEKHIISFFEEDEVCLDNETQEVLDNVGKDIGFDCLELINSDGNNEIYVRNEMLGIDYNIVSETGSYEDYIGYE